MSHVHTIFAAAVSLALSAAAPAADEQRTVRTDHAVVRYAGLDEKHAKALAEVVEAARAAAVEQFGFDMPDTVAVEVTCDRKARPRLFNDGQDRLFLTVRSAADLRQPRYSGIFHIYGLCHEIGHLAMYRPIRDRGWTTTAAAEGWAHYVGSRLVDAVYEKAAQAVWPDAYDYRADGMARLERQLLSRPSEVARGAAQWMKLAEVVGDKGLAPLLAAWGKAQIDPADPAAALRRTLLAAHPDKQDKQDDQKALADWWNAAEALLVLRRPRSDFAARTLQPGDLAQGALTLEHDDGTPAGKSSLAGSGHAVRFKAQGEDWYLAAVSIHGSRYGLPQPPKEDFHVYLCDKDFKQIADFAIPYAKFSRGQARWVTVPVTPTQVPREFVICVAFNPTATKGVYLSRDAEGSGHSLTGLPGKPGGSFAAGDWMVRVELYLPKTADALTPQR